MYNAEMILERTTLLLERRHRKFKANKRSPRTPQVFPLIQRPMAVPPSLATGSGFGPVGIGGIMRHS